MTSDRYLHGVENIREPDGFVLTDGIDNNVIGVVGTAHKGPTDKPILIDRNSPKIYEIFGTAEENANHTLINSIKSIYANSEPRIIAVRADTQGGTEKAEKLLKDALKDKKKSGVKRAANKNDEKDGEEVTEVTENPEDNTNTVEASTPKSISGDAINKTGVFALLMAESITGVKPKILIATGHEWESGVEAALDMVAKKLNATALTAMQETATQQDFKDKYGIAQNATFRSSYTLPIYTWVETDIMTAEESDTTPAQYYKAPATAVTAGMIATLSYHQSPSNKIVKGIREILNPVYHSVTDVNAESNTLNENNTSLIVIDQGYRFWGSRLPVDVNDLEQAKHRFFSSRRTTNFIEEKTIQITKKYLDLGVTPVFFQTVSEEMNFFYKDEKREGRIIGGETVALAKDNNPQTVESGQVVFRHKYTPVYNAERITNIQTITNQYLEELF